MPFQLRGCILVPYFRVRILDMLSILGGDHVRGWFSGARIWRVVAGID